jgi:hypothetical protein
MANPHKGEVEVDFHKSIAKKLIKPKDHRHVYLKLDYNAMADAELQFRGSESLLQVLNKSSGEHPENVSFHDMRVLLAAAMKPQFGGMTTQLAGKILGIEDFGHVIEKIGEAIGLAFEGTISGSVQKDGDEFMRPAEEVAVSEGLEEGEEGDEATEKN